MATFRGDTMDHTTPFDRYISARPQLRQPDLDAAIRLHELLELAKQSLLSRMGTPPNTADTIALCRLILEDIHHRERPRRKPRAPHPE